MATVTAYTAFDMSNPTTWFGTVVAATSNLIQISDGYRTSFYTGNSFGYSGDTVVSGTLTGYSQTAGVLPSTE